MSGLENWLFTENVLQNNSASRYDGITYENEIKMRYKTVWFIDDLANELQRPIHKKVVACAAIFFHRFYTFHSFKSYSRFTIALACLFLASKAEESYCKLRDIVSTYYMLRRQSPTETEVKEMHKQILISEKVLLCSLNFDLNIKYPHDFINTKLKELKIYLSEVERDQKDQIKQMCLNFVNDSHRTMLCMKYSPDKIAAGAILLAMTQMSIRPTSSDQTWFELLERDVDELSLKNIVETMVELYRDDRLVESFRARWVESTTTTQTNGKRKLASVEDVGGLHAKAAKVLSSSGAGSSMISIPKKPGDNLVVSIPTPAFENASSDHDQVYTNDEEEWTERRPLSRKVTYKGSTFEQNEYFEKISSNHKIASNEQNNHHYPNQSPHGSSSISTDAMSSTASTPAFIAPPTDSPPGDHFDSREGGSGSGLDTPASMMYDDATPVIIHPPPSDTPEFPSLPATPHGMMHGQATTGCLRI